MGRQLDVNAITHLVGDKVRDIFTAETTNIYLLDRPAGLIYEVYAYDRGYKTEFESAPMDEGLIAQIINSRQSIVIKSHEEALARGAVSTPGPDGAETQSYMGSIRSFN